MGEHQYRERKSPTKEEREAKKAKARADGDEAHAAKQKEDDAFRANFERLRAERKARENSG